MKRFLKKSMLYLAILTVILIGLDLLSMIEPFRLFFAGITDSKTFISENVGAEEIIPYIEKAETADDTTVLFLGDSVSRQIFKFYAKENPDTLVLTSNAAITPAGQYVLAEKYIETHPDATDVYLFMLPSSLGRTFDTEYGYQYTVMPFVETDTIGSLAPETVRDMESVYGRFFMNPAVVRMIDRSAPNRKLYLNLLKKHSESYMPEHTFDLADEYIGRIRTLCEERGIRLFLLPCPVCEASREDTEALRADYLSSELSRWFPDYFDEIVYYPEEEFVDGVHFKKTYVNREFLNEVLSGCYGDLLP